MNWRELKAAQKAERAQWLKMELEKCGGSMSKLARVTGIHRGELYKTFARNDLPISRVRRARNGNAEWQALQ